MNIIESLFGRAKSPAERLRQHQRTLQKAQRELDRERTKLEQQEKKLTQDIKKSARDGQMVSSHSDVEYVDLEEHLLTFRSRLGPRMDSRRARSWRKTWSGHEDTSTSSTR